MLLYVTHATGADLTGFERFVVKLALMGSPCHGYNVQFVEAVGLLDSPGDHAALGDLRRSKKLPLLTGAELCRCFDCCLLALVSIKLRQLHNL